MVLEMFFHFYLHNNVFFAFAELCCFTCVAACVLMQYAHFKDHALAYDLQIMNASIKMTAWLDDFFVCGMSLVKRTRKIPLSLYHNIFPEQKHSVRVLYNPSYWWRLEFPRKGICLKDKFFHFFSSYFLPVRFYAIFFSSSCIHSTRWKWKFILV